LAIVHDSPRIKWRSSACLSMQGKPRVAGDRGGAERRRPRHAPRRGRLAALPWLM